MKPTYDELLNSFKNILSLLETSTDVQYVQAVYIPPAERLRREANNIESRDRKILEARELVRRAEDSCVENKK